MAGRDSARAAKTAEFGVESYKVRFELLRRCYRLILADRHDAPYVPSGSWRAPATAGKFSDRLRLCA